MKLNTLNKQKNYHTSNKIVGRGPGSGKGMHTVGRGMNGQRSRSGGSKSPNVVFAGGQNTISRQLPKLRGFKAISVTPLVININLNDLNKFSDGDTVNVETLSKLGFVKSVKGRTFKIKVLGTGKIERKSLVFTGIEFTESAKNTLQEAQSKFE